MFNFYFLEKGLGIVSAPNFVYNFLRKMFLLLYSSNWPNFSHALKVLTCQRVFHGYVFTFLRVLRAYLLTLEREKIE